MKRFLNSEQTCPAKLPFYRTANIGFQGKSRLEETILGYFQLYEAKSIVPFLQEVARIEDQEGGGDRDSRGLPIPGPRDAIAKWWQADKGTTHSDQERDKTVRVGDHQLSVKELLAVVSTTFSPGADHVRAAGADGFAGSGGFIGRLNMSTSFIQDNRGFPAMQGWEGWNDAVLEALRLALYLTPRYLRDVALPEVLFGSRGGVAEAALEFFKLLRRNMSTGGTTLSTEQAVKAALNIDISEDEKKNWIRFFREKEEFLKKAVAREAGVGLKSYVALERLFTAPTPAAVVQTPPLRQRPQLFTALEQLFAPSRTELFTAPTPADHDLSGQPRGPPPSRRVTPEQGTIAIDICSQSSCSPSCLHILFLPRIIPQHSFFPPPQNAFTFSFASPLRTKNRNHV